MPVYCYQDREGFLHEKVFKMGEAPKTVKVRGGRRAERCFAAEQKNVPPTKGWPMECLASGVNAEQKAELKGFLDKSGVPTEVTKDGNPVYRNIRHRRKALKARGIVDKSSFI